jgi:hypothetical protein
MARAARHCVQAAGPEKRPSVMLGILSIVCSVSGVAVAYRSARDPVHARCLEIVGGLPLIGGLAVLGIKLELIVEAVNF